MNDHSETELAHFSGWHHSTNIALEYWEIRITSRRVIFCFVGQSYQSLLLKADMGASHRDQITELPPEAVAEFDDQNFVVPLSALETIRLTSPTRFRTATLEFEWDGESMTFRRKGSVDEEREALETLDSDDRFDHVTIAHETSSLLPWL